MMCGIVVLITGYAVIHIDLIDTQVSEVIFLHLLQLLKTLMDLHDFRIYLACTLI